MNKIDIGMTGELMAEVQITGEKSHALIGKNFCGVRITEVLGYGNTSTVFLGVDDDKQQEVAVKILPKAKKETYNNEVDINASVSHPNIVPVLETGETDENYYLIMKPIVGVDMNDLILERSGSKGGILSIKELFNIVFPILDALQSIHERGIIHCDIKPANILADSALKTIYLADFGIAQNGKNLMPQNASVIKGSPLYIAPEQIGGGAIDARVDLYSLGLTIVKLLTGTVPSREEQSEEVIKRKYFDPESFITESLASYDEIDSALAKILETAIQPYPEDRYGSAEEMKIALMEYRMNRSELFEEKMKYRRFPSFSFLDNRSLLDIFSFKKFLKKKDKEEINCM